jgi:type II secretory pathway pseudopilin PulG
MSMRSSNSRRPGFTLVEMLITVAIIIVLLTLLVSALVGVTRGGQRTRTQYLMTNIGTALVTFQKDLGYLPPILDMQRNLMQPPEAPTPANGISAPAFAQNVQDWFSYTSLPEYLIGVGDRSEDGYGFIGGPTALPTAPFDLGEQEFPRIGLRNPGDDGVWGALLDPADGTPGLGLKLSRNLPPATASGNTAVSRYTQGKVYGPYLELKDDRLLGAISVNDAGVPQLDGDGNPIIVFPGEVDNFDELPKVIVDYWGKPLRYYRALYPRPFPKLSHAPAPAGLGDVITLRPYSFDAGTDIDSTIVKIGAAEFPDAFEDDAGDRSTSRLLQAAKFAIFSSGPDRSLHQTQRADEDEFNKDNMVEFGP